MEDLFHYRKTCVNCRLLCTRWITPSWNIFHSSLELTWKSTILSCLCICRFKLVMLENNTWFEHNWKVNFCLQSVPGLRLFTCCKDPFLPSDVLFSAPMEGLCHCGKSCVNCRLLCTRWIKPSWNMFHSSLELTRKSTVLSCLCI